MNRMTDVRPEPPVRPKRFYEAVSVEPRAGGFAVLLDGRQAKTPAAAPLQLPTEPLARLVAEEWGGQGEHVVFADMPATRLAFTVIDRVPSARDEVVQEAARYAGSDLLCYFAEGPKPLAERQAREWESVLAWAEAELGLRFNRTAGVIHRPQPPETVERAGEEAARLDDAALAALAFAAPLLGSIVLAFALQRGRLGGEEAFALSRLDEAHQESFWGVDAEAAARAERMRGEAVMLERWFRALDGSPARG